MMERNLQLHNVVKRCCCFKGLDKILSKHNHPNWHLALAISHPWKNSERKREIFLSAVKIDSAFSRHWKMLTVLKCQKTLLF